MGWVRATVCVCVDNFYQTWSQCIWGSLKSSLVPSHTHNTTYHTSAVLLSVTFCMPHTELKHVLFTLLLPARDGLVFMACFQSVFSIHLLYMQRKLKYFKFQMSVLTLNPVHGTDYVHTPLIKQSELRSDIHLKVVPRRRFAFQTLCDLYIVTFTRH